MTHGNQTPTMLPVRVVQPTIAVLPEYRPAMSSNELKRLDKFIKLHRPHFSCTPFEDALGLSGRFHEILCNLGLVESNEVDFTAFQMQDSARGGGRFTRLVDQQDHLPLPELNFLGYFFGALHTLH